MQYQKIRHIVLFAVLTFTTPYSLADNIDVLQEGQTAFNQHQYRKAFDIWHALAKQNNTDAQVFVGLAYKNGWGVDKDLQRANMWFQMAAEGNNPSGQFFLGLHYVGSKNPKLVSAGVEWLVKSAENGDASAKRFLIKARLKRWFDVPSTLNISVKKAKQVTPDNMDEVFPDSESVQKKAFQQAQAGNDMIDKRVN